MSNILLTEQTAPSSPASTRHTIYPKSDGYLYKKDSAGVETKVGMTANDAVFYDKGNSGTSTQTFNRLQGGVISRAQKLTVTGAHTIAVSNWEASGTLSELLIELVNGASSTITWPTVNWVKSDGTTTTTFSSNGVTLQTSGTDWVLLWTRDGGTTVYGKIMR